jgi:hypothetical protein
MMARVQGRLARQQEVQEKAFTAAGRSHNQRVRDIAAVKVKEVGRTVIGLQDR